MGSYVALITFVSAYVMFVVLPQHRWLIGLLGVAALLITLTISPVDAVGMVNWNVMGVFVGTLILAELFILSDMPAYLAERMLSRIPNTTWAMLAICLLSGLISVVAENVATVLIVAPVALAIARKLSISPVPLMIGVAISSNLQGAATLIGDPPSMILAAYNNPHSIPPHPCMTFTDFFWFQGRPSIFFAIQIGAVFSIGVLYLFYRRYNKSMHLTTGSRYSSLVPTALLGLLIVLLALSSYIDPEFIFLAGSFSVLCAVVGLIWHRLWGKCEPLWPVLRKLDWQTTIFLAAVFILVGAIQQTGWLTSVAVLIKSVTGQNALLTFLVIVGFSMLMSAFIDNVPYLAAMVFVAGDLAMKLEQPPALLLFGLLIGASLGGNITPVGAAANIVTYGYLRKHGHDVSFWQFVRIGLPFTVVAVTASSIFVWFVWG